MTYAITCKISLCEGTQKMAVSLGDKVDFANKGDSQQRVERFLKGTRPARSCKVIQWNLDHVWVKTKIFLLD